MRNPNDVRSVCKAGRRSYCTPEHKIYTVNGLAAIIDVRRARKVKLENVHQIILYYTSSGHYPILCSYWKEYICI